MFAAAYFERGWNRGHVTLCIFEIQVTEVDSVSVSLK